MNDITEAWGQPFRYKQGVDVLPTWQQNQNLDSGQNLANWIDEGYSKNSLIYACIEEIATSFAELSPQLLLPDSRGELQEQEAHEVLELLADPNESMDGYEFLATAATHHRAAGNVYIHKVRRSNVPDRNRSFRAVKELQLIRPDYVTIKPGTRREDDLFEVSISGQVKARLPRRDVIHWRTRNLTNDFYGLSAVALLIYEGNVDSEMTKFDWAFFRNAGVPMGILKTAKKPTPDEARELKGAFRRMFNGMKKWFEVMILPAEGASYEQLGLPIKDMEMPGTRAHVESRICSVFGVPPILVGARVGLEAAGGLTTTSIEGSQFSFWSETMSPLAHSWSSRVTQELFSEYRTPQQRGAVLGLDMSHVKALQEDNSDRLKTALEMVKSGGWTINQALDAVGLPAVDGADFYVRALNQVVETPVTASINGRRAAAMLLEPVVKQRTVRERLAERAEAGLAEFFEGQARRVVSRLPKSVKALDVGDLVPPEEEELLRKALLGFWSEAIEQGWQIGGAEVGLPPGFDPVDPRVVRLLEDGGARITGITEETRKQVQQALLVARNEGLSVRQTARLLEDLPAFSRSRAQMVARTELGTADNLAAVSRYREAGFTHVQVFDGDGDPGCAAANGAIWTIEEFEANPLEHPNCVRSRAPIIPSEQAGNGAHEIKEARCPECGRLLAKDVRGATIRCPKCKNEARFGVAV